MHKRGQGCQPDRVFFLQGARSGCGAGPKHGPKCPAPRRCPAPRTGRKCLCYKGFRTRHGPHPVSPAAGLRHTWTCAGFQGHHLALPGQVIGPLARHLDGGIGRGHLGQGPVKRGSMASIASAVGRTGLVPVTLPSASSLSRASPQLAVKRYSFSRVLHQGHGLGGFAQRDRQDARGHGIERAGMAGLLGIEDAAHGGDGLGRGYALRLVEDHPAVNRVALLLLHIVPAFSPRRALAGRCPLAGLPAWRTEGFRLLLRRRSRAALRRFQNALDLLGFGEGLVFDEAQIGREFGGDHDGPFRRAGNPCAD